MNCVLVNENFKKDYGENYLLSKGVLDTKEFINPSPSNLQDPSNLDGVEEGAKLVEQAIKSDKTVALIQDSDCDGITSSAIIFQYLKKLQPQLTIRVFIHEGKQHGPEDFMEELLERAEAQEFSLLIIPDAGSNSFVALEALGAAGLPSLVIDHHLLDNEVSKHTVLINNQTSSRYTNKELTGAGVVYQFCRYLDRYFGVSYAEDFVDLAALGVVGDMGSMLSLENRYIAVTGFKKVKNMFFQTLLEKQQFSTKGRVNPISVAFYIVPLINAMIRVGTQEEKMRMFMAFVDGNHEVPCNKRGAAGTYEKVAIESARECGNAKNAQGRFLDKAMSQIESKIYKHGLLDNKILFIRLDEEDFPSELNGLLAMRAAALYKKPTIVARLNEAGEIKGSARNVPNSPIPDLKKVFEDSGFFFLNAGHANAFGTGILDKNLATFHQWANSQLSTTNFGEGTFEINFHRAAVDADIKEIISNLSTYSEVWGQDVPEPILYIHDINITKNDITIMGKNKDTLKIVKNGITYIKFFAKEMIEQLGQFDEIKLNIVGKSNLNEYNGRFTPQIIIDAYEMLDNKFGF